MLTEQQKALVAGPHPAVISTIAADGRPVTVPTWHLFDDPCLLLSIDAHNARGDRLAHLRIDPRFTLTVMDRDNWASSLTISATATEMFPDDDLELVDRMARVHGKPRFERRTPRVAVRARIDDVLAHVIPD